MSNKKAVIINGDGTGPELVNSMINVLKSCNSNIELIKCDAGSEWWEKMVVILILIKIQSCSYRKYNYIVRCISNLLFDCYEAIFRCFD